MTRPRVVVMLTVPTRMVVTHAHARTAIHRETHILDALNQLCWTSKQLGIDTTVTTQ
ncbi:hypothetical protein DPMN_050323 [Dreissena polymorpha]|uniref:Uncharacterized protein n=1 Tax=Dreissena polymorpha TaxID=45954 RepID=A0A9D4CFW8_DREPO|nr:hypothetical protein DPMN_050323 [Dreissena polymorpha]